MQRVLGGAHRQQQADGKEERFSISNRLSTGALHANEAIAALLVFRACEHDAYEPFLGLPSVCNQLGRYACVHSLQPVYTGSQTLHRL